MKIWVTKYALSKGVRVCEGTLIKDTMAEVKWPGGMGGSMYVHGQDFQLTEVDALARVREMIEAKQRSLKKQLVKFDKLAAAGTMPVWSENGS